jgi:hypothetical protein
LLVWLVERKDGVLIRLASVFLFLLLASPVYAQEESQKEELVEIQEESVAEQETVQEDVVAITIPVIVYDVQTIKALIYEAAVYYGVSYQWLERVASCESIKYLPTVMDGRRLGRDGEMGLFQLHPYGLLPQFRWYVFNVLEEIPNVYNTKQQTLFAAWAFSKELSSHWSCK